MYAVTPNPVSLSDHKKSGAVDLQMHQSVLKAYVETIRVLT